MDSTKKEREHHLSASSSSSSALLKRDNIERRMGAIRKSEERRRKRQLGGARTIERAKKHKSLSSSLAHEQKKNKTSKLRLDKTPNVTEMISGRGSIISQLGGSRYKATSTSSSSAPPLSLAKFPAPGSGAFDENKTRNMLFPSSAASATTRFSSSLPTLGSMQNSAGTIPKLPPQILSKPATSSAFIPTAAKRKLPVVSTPVTTTFMTRCENSEMDSTTTTQAMTPTSDKCRCASSDPAAASSFASLVTCTSTTKVAATKCDGKGKLEQLPQQKEQLEQERKDSERIITASSLLALTHSSPTRTPFPSSIKTYEELIQRWTKFSLHEKKDATTSYVHEWGDSLTFQERNEAWNDVHGQNLSLGEHQQMSSSEMTTRTLEAMDNELDGIPAAEKTCYLDAIRKCPEIANCNENKLQFLRCEGFDPKLAARRLVKYWAKKVELFGNEQSFHKLCISTILENDEKELYMKFIRLLPGVDSYGRGMLFLFPSKLVKGNYRVDSMLRVLWYMMHCALLREQSATMNATQPTGAMVVISCGLQAKLDNFDPFLYSKMFYLLTNYLPVAIKAYHVCHPPLQNLWYPPYLRLAKLFLGRYLSLRQVFHVGDMSDVLNDLDRLYGVNKEYLPCVMKGVVTSDEFIAWLSYRRYVEGDSS